MRWYVEENLLPKRQPSRYCIAVSMGPLCLKMLTPYVGSKIDAKDLANLLRGT